jgi:hypothetical protein
MTDLPTREDGGIDWTCFTRREQTFMKLAVAHTIERCAKVVDETNLVDENPAEQIRRLEV